MLTWMDPHLPWLAISRSPGSTRTSLDDDLEIIQAAGVQHIICLQEAYELDLNDESILSRRMAIESRGMWFTHEPIEDYCAPTLEQMTRSIKLIQQHELRHERVLVHCQAGLGRAGTVAACALLSKGFEPKGAIVMVRYLRLGAIQSQAQEDFIQAFYTYIQASSSPV